MPRDTDRRPVFTGRLDGRLATMDGPLDDAMKELMAEYEKARSDLAKAHERIKSVSGKARSKNRMISVTVDSRGDVAELKFHGAAWRNKPPDELSKLIVQTIKDAREAAQKEMWAAVGPSLPGGLDLSSALSGDFDWAAALPDSPELPAVIKDFLSARPEA
jgi:DNA-binding protein YbaB